MTFGLFFGEFSYQIAIRLPNQAVDTDLTYVPLAYLMPASETAHAIITSRSYDDCRRRQDDPVDVTLFVPEGLPTLPQEFMTPKP
jgi:hypothetical protein